MKIYMRLMFLFMFLLPLSAYSQTSPTAREIVDISYEKTRIAGAEATATMTIIDGKGRERVRQTAQVTKLYDNGDTEKRLIKFLAPADVKGTGLLTFDYKESDDDIWLYMPALRKTRRIISSERAKNFMGSEFTYADMTPPVLEEFVFTLLGEEQVEEELCWKIEMMPKDEDIADENGFSKRISYIAKRDYVIRKAVYYDIDGELHKELSVGEITEIDPQQHKYRAKLMIMENLQNGRKPILQVDEIVFNPNIDDDYFTTRYLERE